MKFSANLGFLWTDLSLPDAIRSAKIAGFDAVECHWPYDVPPQEVSIALAETGFEMLGLNTPGGNVLAGDNGLTAIPGREDEARAAIDEAIAYAIVIKAVNIHAMAGISVGEKGRMAFISNLRYACEKAAPYNINILIEPLNKYDAPGYFLTTTDQAIGIINSVGLKNLKLMFDCYHVQIMEGNLKHRISKLLPHIGHIQFASVPDRGAPGHGEVDYRNLFVEIDALGWEKPLGAEYKPVGHTEATLGWLQSIRHL